MDRERLTRLLDSPSKVERDDIADLKAMTERFPWFSGAHLLLAVGEHAAGDVLFDEQLRVTAAHLPSRAVLYDQVNDPAPRTSAPTMVVVKEERSVRSMESVESEEGEVGASSLVVAKEIKDEDPLDAQIRGAALASSYELVLRNTPDRMVPLEPMPVVEQKIERPPVVEKERAVQPSTPRRFTDWLSLAEPQDGSALPSGARLDQLANAPDASDWLRDKSATAIDASALVERFVQQVPPPPKAEFFDPQKAAKRSLEDHADLVTETLARIYAQQGNMSKAIAAYERLALKHPEKGEYFRALAKGLEER